MQRQSVHDAMTLFVAVCVHVNVLGMFTLLQSTGLAVLSSEAPSNLSSLRLSPLTTRPLHP